MLPQSGLSASALAGAGVRGGDPATTVHLPIDIRRFPWINRLAADYAYEYGRLARVIGASGVAFAAAVLVPALPPLAGVLVRGTVVVAVFAALLWITKFFKREELQVLARLRSARAGTSAGPETIEFAGEIVAADLPEPDRLSSNPGRRGPRK